MRAYNFLLRHSTSFRHKSGIDASVPYNIRFPIMTGTVTTLSLSVAVIFEIDLSALPAALA